MGMILKDKMRELFKGYPTVSDKYNVAGATLVGTLSVEFGDLVKFSSQKGFYEAIGSGVESVAGIAGFVLSTNVKLALADNVTVPTKPGESFNLALGGTYMAIELDADAVKTDIAPNKSVQVILATGKCTTAAASAGTIETLPGVVFTGTYEEIGEKLLAEILIK